MALNFILEYDHDPFEDVVKEASVEKLLELIRIYEQFERFDRVVYIQEELARRGNVNNHNL